MQLTGACFRYIDTTIPISTRFFFFFFGAYLSKSLGNHGICNPTVYDKEIELCHEKTSFLHM